MQAVRTVTVSHAERFLCLRSVHAFILQALVVTSCVYVTCFTSCMIQQSIAAVVHTRKLET